VDVSRVTTPEVVEGKGPYSQALRVGDWLLIAGQVAWDANGEVVGAGNIEAQARQVFANIEALCTAAGGSLRDIVQLRAFVTDIALAGAVSALRRELFAEPYPTATTVAVSALVQPELLLEVEATAIIPAGAAGG
jgi:enamine deaminase RidA (YjgF/YER057c/UK114 family)